MSDLVVRSSCPTGAWEHGSTVEVATYGRTRIVNGPPVEAIDERVAVLDTAETVAILATLREAHTGEPPTLVLRPPAPPRPAEPQPEAPGTDDDGGNGEPAEQLTADPADTSTGEQRPKVRLRVLGTPGVQDITRPGRSLRGGSVANATPRIIGVVDDGQYEPAAYVRVDELLTWLTPGDLGNPRLGGGLEVLLSPNATDVEYTLRARLAAAGTSAQGVHARRIDSTKAAATELAFIKWIFLSMAGLVLLIGVAGILNVGLATVGERVEEFALRRAVGTPRSLLAGIVLAETLLTGLFTAAVAIGTGVLGLRVLSAVFLEQEPFLKDLSFPWQAGVAGVIAGLLAGLLGGLIPALRAARIPIATVMRA